MNELLSGPRDRYRVLLWFVRAFLICQWWIVPALPVAWTERWLWSLQPARGFPLWFRILFPIALILLPVEGLSKLVKRNIFDRLSNNVSILILCLLSGALFWFLRIGKLELGDSRLLMDHFIPLTTYASVREPLESILHTEFARILFFNWGVHPQTSFMVQSCLLGVLTIGLCAWGLSTWGENKSLSPALILLIFLISPVHLFFGYVEWYTQLAAGLIVFQVFGLRAIASGRGLPWALGGFIFAACSHLVGLAFLPAAFALIAIFRKGREYIRTSLIFAFAFAASLALTFLCLSHRIRLDASVEHTRSLFSFLLPMMREDNPANPQGSWTYAWLSPNHLGDLANEILFCGLFPILLFLVRPRGCEAPSDKLSPTNRPPVPGMWVSGHRLFFAVQLIPCALFLLIWNPWLGFPSDWDLFSFFAWPLIALSVVTFWIRTEPGQRQQALSLAALPAFSTVFAWVVYYHHGNLPELTEAFTSKDKSYFDRRLEAAEKFVADRDWPLALETVEETMREAPDRTAECFSLFGPATIQRMSEEWPTLDKIIPLAVDFEIVSASPQQRILVLDKWGRIFFWEGGYFNDWAPMGLSGVPETKAVDMEIAPWMESGILLTDRGDLYRFPIPSWVDPNPPADHPRLTHFLEPQMDRFPHFMGNLYDDLAGKPLGYGQRAVDLVVDADNRRLIALDTTGNLVSDATSDPYEVAQLAALVRIDAELDLRGQGCYMIDHFAHVFRWPGKKSPLEPARDYFWPAITDFEVGFGGADLYLLEGQGGIVAVSEFGNPRIEPEQLKHFLPTGQPVDYAPYIQDPFPFFIDLELVPGENGLYRMTRNFRIHYSEIFPNP